MDMFSELSDLERPTKSSKMKATATIVINWLRSNFEYSANSHISREKLFAEYSDFCESKGYGCLNSASFGKILRFVFPDVSTRRLGTRGNSKYHYHGIKPKYSQVECVTAAVRPYKRKTGIESAGSSADDVSKCPISFGGPIPGIFGPDDEFIDQFMMRFTFPEIPIDIDSDMFTEFFHKHRDHTRFVLKAALIGDYDSISNELSAHWNGMLQIYPEMFKNVFCCKIVSEWDMMLYQLILSIILPDILGEGDKELFKRFKQFMSASPQLIRSVLNNAKPEFVQEKMRSLQDFNKMLKQYQSLNTLALNARKILESDSTDEMAMIWRNLDLESAIIQAFSICPGALEIMRVVHETVLQKLAQKDSIFKWAEWIYGMCEELIITDVSAGVDEYLLYSQQFLIRWSYISSLVLREIHDINKDMFSMPFSSTRVMLDGFNAIKLFIDEYIKFTVDCKVEEKRRSHDFHPNEAWNHSMESLHYSCQGNDGIFHAPVPSFPHYHSYGVAPASVNHHHQERKECHMSVADVNEIAVQEDVMRVQNNL